MLQEALLRHCLLCLTRVEYREYFMYLTDTEYSILDTFFLNFYLLPRRHPHRKASQTL